MNENELSKKIIGAALEVHRVLGPGLLESAYEASLLQELTSLGLNVKEQIGLPLVYKERFCEIGYRVDLLVENFNVAILKQGIKRLVNHLDE
jgi:GxxExxY protein